MADHVKYDAICICHGPHDGRRSDEFFWWPLDFEPIPAEASEDVAQLIAHHLRELAGPCPECGKFPVDDCQAVKR